MTGVPRWMIAVLAASLALNLFGLGVVARHHMRSRHGRPAEYGMRAFLRKSGLDSAPPDAQQALYSRRDAIHERIRQLHEARQAARAALQAEPFDPQRVSAAFEEVRTRTLAMQAEMHAALIAAAEKLDPAQRKRMAEALWERPRGPRGPRRPHDP